MFITLIESFAVWEEVQSALFSPEQPICLGTGTADIRALEAGDDLCSDDHDDADGDGRRELVQG